MKKALSLVVLGVLATPAVVYAAGDPSEMIPKAINLAILLGAIVYLGKKYVVDFFSNRTATIEKELNAARIAKQEAEQKAKEYEEKYRAVEQELSEMKATSEKIAQEERERIIRDAHELAEKMVANAKASIEIEFKKATNTIRQGIVAEALEQASGSLRSSLNAANNEVLVKEYIVAVKGES